MEIKSIHFKAQASAALANPTLQANLHKFGIGGLALLRTRAVEAYGKDAFEELRNAGEAIRNRALKNLDVWIERFEAEATRRGATVLFARDAKEAQQLVLDICRTHHIKKAIKSKSMVSEEMGLNEALIANGVTPIETDLGEYIIQLAKEPPSHIIAPAVHKSKEEVSELFAAVHGTPRKTDNEALTREAREVLRQHFLTADLGISGANFLVAETGSGLIVTNEGNGRMVTTLPRVHVSITGIEKVVPTLEDVSTLLRLLPRSATGQPISNYVSFFTGPKAAQDLDGPEHMYFILVDNGRSGFVGTDMQEMLRCIRCGACMNHCPVYRTVGGHAYGWVYPGPMGSILTPSYAGMENALDLPHASTLCNQCGVVCPVKIPLPDLLRKMREKQVERDMRPKSEMLGLRMWAFVALHPRLYGLTQKFVSAFLRFKAGKGRRINSLPFIGAGWTQGRDFARPRNATFKEKYSRRTPGAPR
ncbi:MAG TPA: LutB/LldF family L-lactate oxidation iron-sulfur protein [Burkholderiales bacterium]